MFRSSNRSPIYTFNPWKTGGKNLKPLLSRLHFVSMLFSQTFFSKSDVILTVHRRKYVEMKRRIDATEVFFCTSCCLLNMFRVPLCPSSGAQDYYTVVAACGIWCCKDVKSDL